MIDPRTGKEINQNAFQPTPLEVRPPATADQYEQNAVLSGLGTKPPEMPKDYYSYLQSTKDVAPVDFGADPTSANALHLENVNKLKGTAGINMAKGNIQTGDQLYNAMVRNNPDHNPNVGYEGSQLFQKELKTRMPDEWQRYQERQVSEQTAEQQQLSPEEVQLRGRMTPQGQQQFDAAKDQERISALFPELTGKINKDVERGQRTLASEGEMRNAALKSEALSIISTRLENGLIQPAEAAAALRALEKTNSLQYKTTNTVSGASMAGALGLPQERGQDGERYRMGNEQSLGVAREQTTLAVDKRQAEARAQEDQGFQRTKFEQDQEARGATPKMIQIKTAGGTPVDMIDHGGGKFSQIASSRADEADTRQGGLYDNPMGWEYKDQTGKLTVYDRSTWAKGTDGKLYKRSQYKGESPLVGAPDGVTEDTGDKKASSTPKQVGKAASFVYKTREEADKASGSIPNGTIVEIGGKRHKWEK